MRKRAATCLANSQTLVSYNVTLTQRLTLLQSFYKSFRDDFSRNIKNQTDIVRGSLELQINRAGAKLQIDRKLHTLSILEN